jgi:hypothetical protein
LEERLHGFLGLIRCKKCHGEGRDQRKIYQEMHPWHDESQDSTPGPEVLSAPWKAKGYWVSDVSRAVVSTIRESSVLQVHKERIPVRIIDGRPE